MVKKKENKQWHYGGKSLVLKKHHLNWIKLSLLQKVIQDWVQTFTGPDKGWQGVTQGPPLYQHFIKTCSLLVNLNENLILMDGQNVGEEWQSKYSHWIPVICMKQQQMRLAWSYKCKQLLDILASHCPVSDYPEKHWTHLWCCSKTLSFSYNILIKINALHLRKFKLLKCVWCEVWEMFSPHWLICNYRRLLAEKIIGN